MTEFSLQFAPDKIAYWADRYKYKDKETGAIETEVVPLIRKRGYYTRQEFLRVCKWKSDRPQRHCEKNSEEFVQAVTQSALNHTCEQLRIEAFRLLSGVRWPTASALLHFGSPDPYPILDVRALWSLGLTIRESQYNFALWWEYTQHCRELAETAGVSIRTLDRALWQFSKENQ